MSSESWPPQLKEWVARCLGQMTDVNRAEAQAEVRQAIANAFAKKTLWTTNWACVQLQSLMPEAPPTINSLKRKMYDSPQWRKKARKEAKKAQKHANSNLNLAGQVALNRQAEPFQWEHEIERHKSMRGQGSLQANNTSLAGAGARSRDKDLVPEYFDLSSPNPSASTPNNLHPCGPPDPILYLFPPPHPLPLQQSHLSIPPEAMLQDLTEYITKDEEFPTSRGGFGEVWKCTYKRDQRQSKVAVKALMMYSSDQFGEAKEKKIKRIWHELRICARLQHKNILPTYGYTFGFGPLIAIVNPWAENGNLTAYLERSGAALTVVRRFQILRDITHGLQYLHTNNVIHGDFNGPNVLIYGDGAACLADFGLSLMHSELVSTSQASWTSTFKGNLRWMAPELLEEREDGSPVRPSRQSDVFSFGGIMLQVLTNKIPYYHLTNDAAIILCIHKLQKPSRTRYPVTSDKYWHFMEECWSGEPQKRPSTERLVDVVGDKLDLLSS